MFQNYFPHFLFEFCFVFVFSLYNFPHMFFLGLNSMVHEV